MQEVLIHDIGLQDYKKVWQNQKEIFNQSIQEKIEGRTPQHHLIVCEHPHVYTLGKSANQENLLMSSQDLQKQSIEVYDIERGGDITYHGPGQLVVYPIFDLEQLNIGVKKFVYNIEECVIRVLEEFGIKSQRIDDRIGIWLDFQRPNERKIAAIGIKCSRHVSMHGLALNVNTDLSLFQNIIPCGIQDKAVSSIENELGRKIEIADVKKLLLQQFSIIFDINFIKI
ncbi:MAG: lipoyl(octanoyl) transferase LipB [Bacteroidia bacterium]